jgi:hypothetical protein
VSEQQQFVCRQNRLPNPKSRLNDWDAVIAFVYDPRLPPTNNDAERTRTDEGSRLYTAGLSIIETCRKRGLDPWAYALDLIAAARTGAATPAIPAAA